MRSPLRLTVAPLPAVSTLLNIELVKMHLSVSDEFDVLIEGYARSAVEWAEGVMHRSIISRAHEWTLMDFPPWRRQEIRLPRGKTQSVEEIRYYRSGAYQSLTGPSSGSPAGTGYQEDLSSDCGGVLMPPYGSSWPSVSDGVPSPIIIRFTAGWLASEIPEQIIHAITMHVTASFSYRGDDAPDPAIDRAMEALLSGWCLPRIY